MLFPSMDSETMCLLSFERSKRVFAKRANWFERLTNKFVKTPMDSIAKELKIVGVGDFVERTRLYQVYYRGQL